MRGFRVQPVLFGCVIFALGVVWFLRNLGVIEADIGGLISTYWPVIFVIWGIDLLVSGAWQPRAARGRSAGISWGSGLFGLVLVGLGLAIIGRNLGLYWMDLSILWRAFWPMVIILVGWGLIRGASGAGASHVAFMSGVERKTPGWRLETGNYIAFMGGVELDITCADIPEGETVLNLTAVMGGVNVKVPAGLAVECDGTAVLGGVEFFGEEFGGIVSSRHSAVAGEEGSTRRLVIHALAMIGGVEVKRV